MNSIRLKFTIIAGLCLAFILMMNAGVGSYLVKNRQTKSVQARLAYDASVIHEGINVKINRVRELALSIATVLSAKVDKDVHLEFERQHGIQILRKTALSRPEVMAIYTSWKTDAFDGLDSMMGGEPGHDDTGAYRPAWVRTDSGELMLDAVDGAYADSLASHNRWGYTISKQWYNPSEELVSVYVPIEADGEIVGYVGVDFSLELFDEVINGSITADNGHVVQLIANGEPIAGSVGAGELSDNDYFKTSFSSDDALAGWSVMYAIPSSEVTALVIPVIMSQITLGAISLLIGLPALWVLGGRIAKPIIEITGRLEEFSNGDGDLTRRMPVKSKDELGRQAIAFNEFVAWVGSLIKSVRESAEEVNESARVIEDVNKRVYSTMLEQKNMLGSVSSSMNEIAEFADSVAQEAEQASDQARESGAIAKEGSVSIGSTGDTVNAVRDSVEQSARSVIELGEKTKAIGEIIFVINDIADQTNLLALNAAIEAARAGEHGRGFAVVADEVRKLADRTTTATDEIGEAIKGIQAETAMASDKLQDDAKFAATGAEQTIQCGETFQQIEQSAGSVAGIVAKIAQTSGNQAQMSKQVSQSSQEVLQQITESAEIFGNATESANRLVSLSDGLMSKISRFKIE